MATVVVNGVELFYEEHGSGPPLLLVHGTGAYADLWTPVLDGLAAMYRVIAYDRRGFGRSASAPQVRLGDHARDAVALLQALDAVPATVVGWSAGGVIALDLAASTPDAVTELFLAEPAGHMSTHPTRGSVLMQIRSAVQRHLRRDAGAAAQVMYRWVSGYTTGGNAYDRLPEAWREQMVRSGPNTVREMSQLLRPYPSQARTRSIRCPVTVIEGDLSQTAFVKADAFITGLLPQARTISLAGAAHFLHIDQPELWVEAVAPTREPRDVELA